ncbi:DC-STAMP domain-containing protein 2, partial [Anthophora quadrimaculata]
MAFFQLVLKARKLEKVRKRYEDEKLTSIEISKGDKPRFTLKQRFRRRKLWLKKKVKHLCDRILAVPKNTWTYRKIVAIRTDGTLENYVAKSLLGFVGGVFLTYIFFIFFVFQLKFKLSSATFLCTVIGMILTLGLAFSLQVRCVVFLLLPQFFSKRGRQALMAYAFILAITGPVKNTVHNTAVLSESLSCAQEQLKEAVKSIIDLAKQPFYALRDAITKVVRSVKAVVKKIKQTLIAIKRLVLSILKVITAVFQWLGSIINMCNKKLGTPFDRCQSVFDGAVADCKAKLGPIFGLVCNVTYVVGALCYVVKPLDFICMLVSYVADTVVGAVRSKIKKFTMHMKAMFYVKVKFAHSFQFETNQSKSVQDVSTSIAAEIRERTDGLFGFFDWMNCLTSFFVFFILLRVMRYRYKWLTSERFDNRYITKDLRTIDLIRARQEKETVLPLNPREKSKYAPLSSVFLIKSEKTKLARSVVFLGLATMKLVAYMAIDYSLYWMLHTIQVYGRFESKVGRPSMVTIHVSGEGYLSELYRSIVNAFTPHGKEAEIDTMLCLPDPIPPDLDKYTQIAVLIIFSWLMAFFEPYGLRLRHVVLCEYYPDRAKQRATWLYNHIIRSRGSFLKFARRQLRRKFGLAGDEKTEKVTFKERLWAICPFLNICFPMKQNMCLLCGAVERSDDNPHVKCPTPDCVGLFCTQCFADLQNTCTICRSPLEYGDLSDMSEEKDSSEDQFESPVVKAEEEKEEEELEMEVEEKEEPVEEEEEEEREEEEVEAPIEEEQVEEEETRTEKDVAEQTDEKYEEDLDRSSEYSYTYQDESPEEVETEKRREPFKDVEAQKIRDDVTIQIFNEPFVKESSSSCGSPTSGFVVRAHRKVRAKRKKPVCGDSDSSMSIADLSSEEISEEEVIHIEVDDDSEELLPRDREDKRKLGRISRIVGAVARIPWLGKAEDNGKPCRGLQRRRPSLMNRIVNMLQKKKSMPVQSYRRVRKIKDSSSSTSCSCDDENEILLKVQGRESRKSYEMENVNMGTQCPKTFPTKQIPRYLEAAVSDTSYFEVDETEDSRPRKCVRQVEDVNELLATRAPLGVRKKDSWNITEDDELGLCTCTSEITFETTEDKDIYSLGMSTIPEHTDSTLKTITKDTEDAVSKTVTKTETETGSKSDTDYTESTAETESTSEKQEKFDDSSEYEESKDLGESDEGKTELEEKVPDKIKAKKAGRKDKKQLSVPKETDEGVTDETVEEEKSKSPEETVTTIYTETERPSLYDPFAGLELYSVTDKSKKRRKKPTVRKKISQSEVEKTEKKPRLSGGFSGLFRKRSVHDDNTNEETTVDSRAVETKIDKATDLPDRSRSTQTKFLKHDNKDKHSQQNIRTSDAKEFKKLSKQLDKDSEKEGKKYRKRLNFHLIFARCKADRIKRGSSKRRKCRCSDKSTLTEVEEFYPCTTSKPKRSIEVSEDTGEIFVKKRRETDKLGLHEPTCSAREHQYERNDETDICRSSILETPQEHPRNDRPDLTRQRFETPVLKKYLPMYQTPELIEELKRHDRMRLIREREARMHRIESPSRFSDSTSVRSKLNDPRVHSSFACNSPVSLMEQDEGLPYQRTQAYRNVLCEFQKRTGRREHRKKSDDSVPLICLSKKADKSKTVEQLYPLRNRRGSDVVKKFAHRLMAPFKPVTCKRYKCKMHAEEQTGTTSYDYSYDPEFFSETSSPCGCVKKPEKSNVSTSGDETTDNNE